MMTLTSMLVLLVTVTLSPLRSISTMVRPIGDPSRVTAYTSCAPASLFAAGFGGAACAPAIPAASAAMPNAVKRFIQNSCPIVSCGLAAPKSWIARAKSRMQDEQKFGVTAIAPPRGVTQPHAACGQAPACSGDQALCRFCLTPERLQHFGNDRFRIE